MVARRALKWIRMLEGPAGFLDMKYQTCSSSKGTFYNSIYVVAIVIHQNHHTFYFPWLTHSCRSGSLPPLPRMILTTSTWTWPWKCPTTLKTPWVLSSSPPPSLTGRAAIGTVNLGVYRLWNQEWTHCPHTWLRLHVQCLFSPAATMTTMCLDYGERAQQLVGQIGASSKLVWLWTSTRSLTIPTEPLKKTHKSTVKQTKWVGTGHPKNASIVPSHSH